MEKIEKSKGDASQDEDLGFLLQQLEELENFYPCYRTMIKEEE
jgi:hypothetical protein